MRSEVLSQLVSLESCHSQIAEVDAYRVSRCPAGFVLVAAADFPMVDRQLTAAQLSVDGQAG